MHLDRVAFVGYTLLFTFGLYKLSDTFKRPVDLISNVLLLVGLFALMMYHFRKIRTGLDENTEATQKKLRLVAHSSITSFFLLTLTPLSKSVFQPYDVFGLVAHAFLIYAVAQKVSQTAGVGLLALYFAFASLRSAQRFRLDSVEVLNSIGRFVLLVFFGLSFADSFKQM